MPRKPAISPAEHLHLKLEAEDALRLRLFLFSEAEGRVPQGAYKAFFTERVREFFNQREGAKAASREKGEE